MKKTANLNRIPLLVLAAGISGAFARAVLYFLGRDASGLLEQNHPLQLLCWLLSAAVALCLGAALFRLKPQNHYASNFPKNPRALPMAITAAAGIAFTVLTDLNVHERLTLIWAVLGLLSAAALIGIGIYRMAGKQPKFFLYGVLCLFYGAHMVRCYQMWSGNPQLPDYCFSLLACACLIIGAYQRTAFCVGAGHRRTHLFFCLMAGFFCVLCTPASEHPWLYLTSGCFFLSDLTMTAHTRHREE